MKSSMVPCQWVWQVLNLGIRISLIPGPCLSFWTSNFRSLCLGFKSIPSPFPMKADLVQRLAVRTHPVPGLPLPAVWPTVSWILVGFVNCWVTKGTPDQVYLGGQKGVSPALLIFLPLLFLSLLDLQSLPHPSALSGLASSLCPFLAGSEMARSSLLPSGRA